MSNKDKPDIGDAVCVMYPAQPCDTPTTLTTEPPHRTAGTGQDFGGPFVTFAILAVVGISALGSLRHFARERFVRR